MRLVFFFLSIGGQRCMSTQFFLFLRHFNRNFSVPSGVLYLSLDATYDATAQYIDELVCVFLRLLADSCFFLAEVCVAAIFVRS